MQRSAKCKGRTANGGGLQHHHRQPNVKQGGAASSRSPTHSTPQFVVSFVEARLSEARGQVTATGELQSECTRFL